jgi:cytochrome P450
MDDGTFIPEGSQVGMNAWVVHLNSVFGPDPKSSKPERWLKGEHENEEAYKGRIAAMRRADLTFGHGSRTCIGKNISYMEIYKFDSQFVTQVQAGVTRWSGEPVEDEE